MHGCPGGTTRLHQVSEPSRLARSRAYAARFGGRGSVLPAGRLRPTDDAIARRYQEATETLEVAQRVAARGDNRFPRLHPSPCQLNRALWQRGAAGGEGVGLGRRPRAPGCCGPPQRSHERAGWPAPQGHRLSHGRRPRSRGPRSLASRSRGGSGDHRSRHLTPPRGYDRSPVDGRHAAERAAPAAGPGRRRAHSSLRATRQPHRPSHHRRRHRRRDRGHRPAGRPAVPAAAARRPPHAGLPPVPATPALRQQQELAVALPWPPARTADESGVPPQRGRTSVIRQLVLQAPAPVIAKALGYHDKTAARLVTEAGGTWSRYARGDHQR